MIVIIIIDFYQTFINLDKMESSVSKIRMKNDNYNKNKFQ